MITFSHEDYIVQAIESVITQIVNFELELLVADDASPDNTQTVIEELIHSHPKGKLIRYHRHEKNMGAQANFLWALQQARGEFIATLDGDDFWTDPNKLQKQLDFLTANTDCAGCFHNTKLLIADNYNELFLTKNSLNRKLNAKDLVEGLIPFGHTTSLFFRKSRDFSIPGNFVNNFCDRILIYLVAQRGYWYGLDEVMSVYRFHTGGIYSPTSAGKQLQFMLTIYQSLKKDHYSFHQYKHEIKKRLVFYNHELMTIYKKDGQRIKYFKHLIGFILNQKKDLRLLKILVKEEVIG